MNKKLSKQMSSNIFQRNKNIKLNLDKFYDGFDESQGKIFKIFKKNQNEKSEIFKYFNLFKSFISLQQSRYFISAIRGLYITDKSRSDVYLQNT